MPGFFYRLPQNLIAIFSGRNLLWHASAIVLTIAIVTTGGDWEYYRLTRGQLFLQSARPALRLGMLVPVLSSLYVLIVGLAFHKRRIATTAWAMAQSAILAWLVTSFYKAFTGRRPPPIFWHDGAPVWDTGALLDSSRGFRFGFLKGGIFWGWPSGHTTVAFSMSVCLLMLYPKNRVLGIAATLYAVYIGLGVSVTIHWLSEFVAGALIGSVVGLTVGKSFAIKLNEQANCVPTRNDS